jgi:peptidoglycan/LPS O-acetylase OafA/YrhL
MHIHPEPPHNHLKRIDILRAVAILMVVCFHFLPSITGQYELGWRGMWRDVGDVKSPLMWWLYPLTFGWSGVSLFFVISGFCIHYSFLKHEVKSPGKPFLKQFFWKRFWRIYPPYFAALIVFYFLAVRHFENGATPINFWLHLLLLHNLDAGTFNGINPSFWSLAVEMQFYLLFPLVLALRQKIGIKRVFWLFAGLSFVCRVAALFLQDWNEAPTQFLWILLSHFLWIGCWELGWQKNGWPDNACLEFLGVRLCSFWGLP